MATTTSPAASTAPEPGHALALRDADDPTQPETKPSKQKAKRPRTVGHTPAPTQIKSVRWLAAALFALTAIEAGPALRYYQLATAPGWARVVLLLAVLQLGYIAWMLLVPDWSTVRVAMLTFAVVAALSVAALSISMFTPSGKRLLLGLSRRELPRIWCAGVLIFSCVMTYACGRVSFAWRKLYG